MGWLYGRGFCVGALLFTSTLANAQPSGSIRFMEPYVVEGLAVGSPVVPDSWQYKRYNCRSSAQYENSTWCTFSETKGVVTKVLTILHLYDNVVTYVNKELSPASFTSSEVNKEIARLSGQFSGSPHIYKSPNRPGLPGGIIATWGGIELQPLSRDDLATLAQGKSPNQGVLVDYLMDFHKSARAGLPIYSLSGGAAGYVWVARFDKEGKGKLRFFAADPSQMKRYAAVTSELSQPDAPPLAPAPKIDVPVVIGGNERVDACGETGEIAGLDPQGDGFLSVRGGPGGRPFREIDRLFNGNEVYICDRKEPWFGVVYNQLRQLDENCGVSKAWRTQQSYTGPCRYGWIHSNYVHILETEKAKGGAEKEGGAEARPHAEDQLKAEAEALEKHTHVGPEKGSCAAILERDTKGYFLTDRKKTTCSFPFTDYGRVLAACKIGEECKVHGLVEETSPRRFTLTEVEAVYAGTVYGTPGPPPPSPGAQDDPQSAKSTPESLAARDAVSRKVETFLKQMQEKVCAEADTQTVEQQAEYHANLMALFALKFVGVDKADPAIIQKWLQTKEARRLLSKEIWDEQLKASTRFVKDLRLKCHSTAE